MASSSLILVSLLPLLVSAVNDWSVPCFQGVCSYDAVPSTTLMPSSMMITGSMNAISDITTAAGWEILECDPNTMSQDIRLVCKSNDTASAGCDHLYQNGAEDTVVRLPETCGNGPFARVVSAWVPSDQTIPSSVAARIFRRDGVQPEVKALSLDTNFTQIAASRNGNVTLAIQGSTNPGSAGNFTLTPASSKRRTRAIQRRGLDDFVKGALDSFSNATSFNKTSSENLPPIDVNQSFPIFNSSISCGSATASIDISADTQFHAQVSLGVVAAGTLVPPEISEFAVYTGLTADLDGALNINTSLSGTLDSGTITLFEVGIPGLDFPGILTVGPSFKLNAEATAELDVDLDMTINLAYHVNDVQLFFPPSYGLNSTGNLSPDDAPLKLSVSPNVASNLTFEAHLIPTIDLGIDALDGLASATVFLDLDASATLGLSLDAGLTSTKGANSSTPVNVNGCVDLQGGLAANAGADGSFLDLFNDSTMVPIFDENFQLFQKCFGTAVLARKARRSLEHPVKRAGLSCLSPDVALAVSLIDETLASSSFKAL